MEVLRFQLSLLISSPQTLATLTFSVPRLPHQQGDGTAVPVEHPEPMSVLGSLELRNVLIFPYISPSEKSRVALRMKKLYIPPSRNTKCPRIKTAIIKRELDEESEDPGPFSATSKAARPLVLLRPQFPYLQSGAGTRGRSQISFQAGTFLAHPGKTAQQCF